MTLLLSLLRYFIIFGAGIFGVVFLVYLQSFIFPPVNPETKEAIADLLTLGGAGIWKLACLELAFYHDFFHNPRGRGIFLLIFLALIVHGSGCDNIPGHLLFLMGAALLYGLAWLLYR